MEITDVKRNGSAKELESVNSWNTELMELPVLDGVEAHQPAHWSDHLILMTQLLLIL